MAKAKIAPNAAPAAAVQAEEKSYVVLKNLRHDGKHYGENATVALNAAEAKPLLELGVVAGPALQTTVVLAEASESDAGSETGEGGAE